MKFSLVLSVTLAGFAAATPVATVEVSEIFNGTTRGTPAKLGCSTPGMWSCCGLSDGTTGTCECGPTGEWQQTAVCGISSSCCTLTDFVPHCIC